jgi:16S rRNA (guanine1516-N2)-methyltransferase
LTITPGRAALAVVARHDTDSARAEALGRQLGLPLVPGSDLPLQGAGAYAAVLLVDGERLSLQALSPAGAGRRGGRAVLPGPVSADFGSAAMRHRRRGGQNELLGRAVGVSASRQPAILDATAGLGRDSFVLADMGCSVTLCERDPVIAALLQWGLAAAAASEDAWLARVARRMALRTGDARDAFADGAVPADVIYLDPMFPPRDKSAAVKKEMALFQLLLDSDAARHEAADLLAWALGQDVARVVVKRPARAEPVAGAAPSHHIAGKAVRFDVYVRRALA